MTLIEKLLRFQTINGPYLGENRPLQAVPVGQNFQALIAKPAPTMPAVLQSASQQLQINIQVKASITPAPAPSTMLVSPLQIMASPKLNAVTINQIQQHPVTSQLELNPELLLLLEAFKRQGRKRPPEQLIPSPNAQLSFLAIERPFIRSGVARRKLSVQGLNFLRFKFVWEDDDDPSEQRRRQQQQQELESLTSRDEDSL